MTGIKLLDESSKSSWDAFVQRHKDGTFYHLSGWRDIIGGVLKHKTYYFYLEQNGEIDAVLPLARVKSRIFGDALISLPFLVYGGPVGNDPDSVVKLIDHAKDLAVDLGVDHLELRNRRPVTDWPAKDAYVTFRKTMEHDRESNLLAIPNKKRAVVRKAIKQGLTAEIDENVDRLYELLSENKRNLGTPFFGRKYLDQIKRTFGDDCEVLTVTHDGDVLSSVMSFRFRDEILPYYGGGGFAARKLGANDFMYWKVMENACAAGLKIFDYGRSRAGTGAYNSKKYWGFDPTPLSYEYFLVKAKEVPSLDPSNSRYKSLVEAWSRLPLPIAKMLGPSIARMLG